MNVDLPIIKLYSKDEFTIKYLSVMPMALLPLPKRVMKGMCLTSWTYFLEKSTRVPLKGSSSYVSMIMPLKES